MEIELPPDFKEFLRSFRAHGVKYLLVGGYAVGYYGYPRATNHLDIWIEREAVNAEKVVAVFREFGFDAPNLSSDLFLKGDSIVRIGVAPMRIEVITDISGVIFERCYPQRRIDSLDGVEVNLIDLASLKINKKASGRHKDLDDLEHLV